MESVRQKSVMAAAITEDHGASIDSKSIMTLNATPALADEAYTHKYTSGPPLWAPHSLPTKPLSCTTASTALSSLDLPLSLPELPACPQLV